jgi:hypothetical protein
MLKQIWQITDAAMEPLQTSFKAVEQEPADDFVLKVFLNTTERQQERDPNDGALLTAHERADIGLSCLTVQERAELGGLWHNRLASRGLASSSAQRGPTAHSRTAWRSADGAF